jgi:hypothetical protein
MTTDTRGLAPLVVIAAIAAVGALALWTGKPKATHGDSRRAAESTTTTAALVETTRKQGAEAAASVVKIGEANAQLPGSALSTFIGKEVGVALAKLPAPDPQALIEAEKRKVAVLEGKVEAIASLYDAALKRADALDRERGKALAARQEADLRLEQVAAERLGAERQRNQMMLVMAVAVALYIYVKVTHLSPASVAGAIADIRKGTYPDPVTALDVKATPIQQSIISFLHRFNHQGK